jgi:hypothetical protein
MSYFAQQQAAARQALRSLAQMSGMTGEYNTRYGEEDLVLVYGQPQIDEEMNRNGGFSKTVVILATLTREQRATCPAEQTLITRNDITPNVTYRIAEADDKHDAVFYTLKLVKTGP